MIQSIREDIHSAFERDPAARSPLEVFLTYPGLHALWFHHLSSWLWRADLRLLGRLVSQIGRFMTGIEIHPGARIGRELFIDHGMGVVIGETAEVGNHVTLYHGVTLGGVSLNKGKRHPTIEDNVVIGAGAKILGAITVGSGSRIGANAVVVKSVPPNSVVVGVPGQVVVRSVPRPGDTPDLDHNRLPDTLGDSLVSVMHRLDKLEKTVKAQVAVHPGTNGASAGNGTSEGEHVVHAPDHGLWHGEDFSI